MKTITLLITDDEAENVVLSNQVEFDNVLKGFDARCLIDRQGHSVYGFESLEDGATYSYKLKTGRPPLSPASALEEKVSRLTLEFQAIKARQSRDRPTRDLSIMSNSDAWENIVNADRVSFCWDFFFPLKSLPQGFTTNAFASVAPGSEENENKKHHPYFLEQVGILIGDAVRCGMTIRQQFLWTKHGKWLTLDDSASNGTEPDFSTISHRPPQPIVGRVDDGAKAPSSKYEVSAVFEQKKKFTETDQMEAVDYAQRLLCVQREREFAITALFHCQGSEKIIRWFRVEIAEDGGYFTKVTKPASLAPGEGGQRQLLTLLCLTSPEIGLDHPSVFPSDGGVCDVRNWLGRGATSKVYGATWGERMGVVKILQQDYIHYAANEKEVLEQLEAVGVPGVPKCEQIAPNALFFDEVLTRIERCSSETVRQLLKCLEAAHRQGIVHRDVRPENVMEESSGRAVLNDWGCSAVVGHELPFSGTFRYASEEVLNAAMDKEMRAPLPKDDLHSLVRTVLALNDPELRRNLSNIRSGDYSAAKEFWINWRQVNHLHEQFFSAAENLQYDVLHQLR